MSEQRPRPVVYAPPTKPYLSVLHRDEDVVVVSKQSGLLSVPGRGAALADCLEARVRAQFPGARIVHRLDLDTSGVMVLALNREAHRHLGQQFEKRQVTKVYNARVWGLVRDDAGEIDAPLICDWPNRPRQIIDRLQGRQALTAWQVVHRDTNITRVRLIPKTGRSHQLRVHMLSIGHPILGDNIYAHSEACSAADRMQLHAQSLTFHHPTGGMEMTIEDACPF